MNYVCLELTPCVCTLTTAVGFSLASTALVVVNRIMHDHLHGEDSGATGKATGSGSGKGTGGGTGAGNSGNAPPLSPDALLFVIVVLMSISGACCLGFVGVGLTSAVLLVDVSETYSVGFIEWFLQIFGAVFPLVSTDEVGFTVCCGAAWFVTVLLLLFGAFPGDGKDGAESSSLLPGH